MPSGILNLNIIAHKDLVLAKPDVTLFILDTGASKLSIRPVLSQKINHEERPIAYSSQPSTNAERHYCLTRKELLAVI